MLLVIDSLFFKKVESFLIRKAKRIPVIKPLKSPALSPISTVFVSLHQWTILLKIQKEPIPMIVKVNVEKMIKNDLNAAVNDFLCIPTSTDVDIAPMVMPPKMIKNNTIETKMASNTLIALRIIAAIRSINKNKLNSSPSGFIVCKRKISWLFKSAAFLSLIIVFYLRLNFQKYYF